MNQRSGRLITPIIDFAWHRIRMLACMMYRVNKYTAIFLGKLHRIVQNLQKLIALIDDSGISRVKLIEHKHQAILLI